MSSAAVILLHGAMNMFGSGRSLARAFLFAAVFVLSWLLVRKAQTGAPGKFGKAAAIALGVVLVLGASMQLWFSHRLGVSPFAYTVVIQGPEVTSTSLLHNHFGKAAFGDLARALRPAGYERLDPGSAIASVAPLALKAAFSVSLAIFLLVAFASYRRSAPEKRRLSYALGFSALALVATKTAVDGGIFAEHGVLGVGLFLALSMSNPKAFWRAATLSLAAQFLVYATINASGLYASSDETWLLYALMSLGTWCFACYFISRSLFPGAERRLLKVCSFGWVAVMAVSALSQLQLVSYRMLPADGARVATYAEQKGPSYALIGKVGSLFTYEYTGPKTVGRVIDDNGALDNTYPVSVPWKTCLPTGPSQKISFIERDVEGGSSTPRSLYLDACQPRPVSFLQESVNRDGGIIVVTDIQGL